MSDVFERYNTLDVFKKPQCLLKTDESGHLAISQTTAEELRNITLPVNVVAIAGLYRTGKSYLMNRLAGETSGFALGNTIQSKTKGIWAWCKRHPTQKDQVLLLLDTEGLGDVKKGSKDHDNKIFIIATLLSSTLVYNMLGAFSEDAVEKLTFISKMSENLQVSVNDTSDDDFDLLMPEFVLCLRDFSLNLEIDEKECTADEYLEDCLKEKTSEDDKTNEKYNRPRQCIKKYFTERKAFTFDRPGKTKSIMKTLDNATEKDLSEDFIQEAVTFASYIYERPGKILHNKKPVTGCMILALLEVFVKAMRNGKVPCVDDAITVMSKQENEKLAKDAVVKFRDDLKKVEVPVGNKTKLLEMMVGIKTKYLACLTSNLLFDKDKAVELSVETELERISKEFEEENDRLVYEMCMKKINEIYSEDVKGKLDSGAYMVSGGYEKYKNDMQVVINKYRKKLEKKNIDDTQLSLARLAFMKGKTSERNEIMTKVLALDKIETEEKNKKKIEQLRQQKEKELERMRITSEMLKDLNSAFFQLSMALITLEERMKRERFEILLSEREAEIERLQQRVSILNHLERRRHNADQRRDDKDQCILS